MQVAAEYKKQYVVKDSEKPWVSQSNQLLLCSLNTVTKEATPVTRRLGWASPDPRLGPMVQLCCGEAGRLLNFFGISERLPCQRIAPEEALKGAQIKVRRR